MNSWYMSLNEGLKLITNCISVMKTTNDPFYYELQHCSINDLKSFFSMLQKDNSETASLDEISIVELDTIVKLLLEQHENIQSIDEKGITRDWVVTALLNIRAESISNRFIKAAQTASRS